MPEIRELILQDHMGASLFRLPGWGKLASRLKLGLRRVVVATSIWPLSSLYALIYKLHVWYARRALKGLPGVRAIYLMRGSASREIVFGVSDVDVCVLGEWSAAEHEQVMQTLRRFSRFSPLYDRMLWQHAHTIEAMRNLHDTDYWYQFRFDQGRRQWRLLEGQDIVATLPPVPQERIAGGYYMDVRNWWGTFQESAFAFGVTAGDPIFRNSIAYKTAGEMLTKAAALETGNLQYSRRKAIDDALDRATGADRDFLDRLRRSASRRHLSYDGDIQNDTFHFLLRLLEDFHARMDSVPPFLAMPGAGMRVDAVPEEVLRTKAAEEQALEIVEHAKRTWPGYRAAFLVPSISFLTMDDLMLLLEVDPSQPPSVGEVRELCRRHIEARPRLPQRVALLLLLKEGAYQIETVSLMELWHQVICPAANPDVFRLLSDSRFVLDGSPRASARIPEWTGFAGFLIDEELGVRRTAAKNVNADPSMTPLEIVRNVWRHMQLEIVQRSTSAGQVTIPLTPAAIQRALASWGLPDLPVLHALREAYEAGLEGKTIDVHALLPELMTVFAQLQ